MSAVEWHRLVSLELLSLLRKKLNCAGLFSDRGLIFQGAGCFRKWWWVGSLKYQVSFGMEPYTVSEKSLTQASSSSLPKIPGLFRKGALYIFEKEPYTSQLNTLLMITPWNIRLPEISGLFLFRKGALCSFGKEPYTSLLIITSYHIRSLLERSPTQFRKRALHKSTQYHSLKNHHHLDLILQGAYF